MDHHHKEAVGFLARWLLLAFGVACFVAFARSAMQALEISVASKGADVVLSDAVWHPWRRMHATGYLFPRGWAVAHTQFMTVMPDDRAWMVYGSRSRVHATVQDPTDPSAFPVEHVGPEGMMLDIAIKGLPHAGYAFRSAEAKLLIVPPGLAVFAVDVGLLRPSAGDEDALRTVVSKLRSRGKVAFFYTGAPDMNEREIAAEYLKLRRDVRTRFPDCPLVFTITRQYEKMSCLRKIRWTARDGASGSPIVITGDPELAATAAGRGFPTHLIGPRDGRVAKGRLSYHGSMADFAGWLELSDASPGRKR